MTIIPASVAAVAAARLPVTPTSLNKAAAIASAAQHLLLHLDVSFQEVVHSAQTEQAEVAEASDSGGEPNGHP
jgi:protein strawberry notch